MQQQQNNANNRLVLLDLVATAKQILSTLQTQNKPELSSGLLQQHEFAQLLDQYKTQVVKLSNVLYDVENRNNAMQVEDEKQLDERIDYLQRQLAMKDMIISQMIAKLHCLKQEMGTIRPGGAVAASKPKESGSVAQTPAIPRQETPMTLTQDSITAPASDITGASQSAPVDFTTALSSQNSLLAGMWSNPQTTMQ